MTTSDPSGENSGKPSTQERLRYLVARVSITPPETETAVTPEVSSAIGQTIAVYHWLTDLYNDGFDNYRGGTLEKTDVPFPAPPQGDLVPHILSRLGLLDKPE